MIATSEAERFTKEMAQENKNNERCVGYLAIRELSPDLFRGGLLLVDERGRPVDFRCTSAIKPTAIQKVLYGQTLAGHLALELCASPLIEALSIQPVALFVADEALLALQASADFPVVWARRQSGLVSSGRTSGMAGDDCEIVAAESARFEPVLLAGRRGDAARLQTAAGQLRVLGGVLDPLEPFMRIDAALKLVQEKTTTR